MTPRWPGPGPRLAKRVALAGGALLLCCAACRVAGLRINTSPSMPLGLYRTSPAPVVRGAYVLLCPPQTPVFALARARGYLGAGFCPGGHGYLMKQVLATPGDRVRFAADGVRVNGQLLAASAALTADAAGRPLPRPAARALTLGAGELLLMSPTRPAAFDARYFGPVPLAQVQSVLVPVLTWPPRLAMDKAFAGRPGPLSGPHLQNHRESRMADLARSTRRSD